MQPSGLYPHEIELVRERLLRLMEKRDTQGRPLSLKQMGLAVDRSPATLSNFLHRKDRGDIQDLAERLKAYLDREEAKDAGGLLEVPFVETRQALALMEAVQFAHRYSRMGAVVGGPGFGKSRTIAELVARDKSLIVMQASCVLGVSGVLQELCSEIRESEKGLLRALQKRIKARLAGSGRCIIVDDAHTLTFRALDVLRTIYDQTKIGMVLVGIRALKRQLVGTSEELEQLASRVSGRIWELPDFNEADLALLLEAVVRPDDLEAAMDLIKRDPQTQGSARRVCNALEIAGKLAERDGGKIKLAHLRAGLKVAA
jgi:DNA transposition AAA+ family ATPase